MNKIQKVDSLSQIKATLKNLIDLGSSVYLWQKNQNSLILNKAILSKYSEDEEKLEFTPANTKENLRYKDGVSIFCYFEENCYIFKSMVLTNEKKKVLVTFPKFVIFLQGIDKKQSKKSIHEIIEELSDSDQNNELSQMLGQLLSIMGNDDEEKNEETEEVKKIPLFDSKNKTNEPKKYAFAPEKEVKESTTKYVLDNKNEVQENSFKAQKITYSKEFSSVADNKAIIKLANGSQIEVPLNDVLTDSIIIELSKEDELKVDEEVKVLKILGQNLPGEIKAKVEKVERPSDYTKSFYATLKYTETGDSYRRESNKERIGLKVYIGEKNFTDEYFYDLEKTTTDSLQILAVDKIDLHIGLKVLVTNMYGIRLDKEIKGEVYELDESVEKGTLVTIKYIKEKK